MYNHYLSIIIVESSSWMESLCPSLYIFHVMQCYAITGVSFDFVHFKIHLCRQLNKKRKECFTILLLTACINLVFVRNLDRPNILILLNYLFKNWLHKNVILQLTFRLNSTKQIVSWTFGLTNINNHLLTF